MHKYFSNMRVVLLAWLALTSYAASQQPVIDYTAYNDLANQLLGKMTLAEKVGQMTQAELGYLEDFSQVRTLALGSVLSGGGSDPKEGNERDAWAGVYKDCQAEALKSRLGIPILYGVDAVHGHSNVLGAVIFPHNIGLGCTGNESLIEEVNRITAVEMRATGIHWNFAPCVTVPRDDRWGRAFEGFSEDPELVTRLGVASVRGMQGSDLTKPLSVLACAKHYVGDGGTTGEMKKSDWPGFGDDLRLRLDQGDTRCDEETLRRVHLAPYPPAIAAGVGTIMPSYSSWNGVKCSGNKYLLTNVLKEELGFEGFLISDYNAIDQITEDYKEAIGISVNAGMDMFMVPQKFELFIEHLTALVEEGTVPMERIDDAVRRILRVKAAMGLLDGDAPVEADPDAVSAFGSDEHRAVARQAVRESLVLLKNENAVLPIDPTAGRVVVAGAAADDIGMQCGGWTIEWQGEVGEITTGGTTILEALQAAADGAEVIAADEPDFSEADVAVLVVGEKPYAEGIGDDAHLILSKEDVDLIHKADEADCKIVLVLVSGRPMIIDHPMEHCDAVVAAWLPGTEGAGVADVLFGAHAPTGKLSFTWPREADQHPINTGDEEYDPLYPIGYGLSY